MMDFQTIYGRVMTSCHHAVTETALLTMVKDWINTRYHDIWAVMSGADPVFGRSTSVLTTVASYTDGTVTTDGTTTIIGLGTTFTSEMVGRKFKTDTDAEVFIIAAYVSATEITLDKAINADDDDGISYTIYDDELSLPSGCNAIVCLRVEKASRSLRKIGLREIRSKQVESPFLATELLYNDPAYWAYGDLSTIVVYPAPTRQIGIKLDYTLDFTELSDAEDEPVLPVDYHNLLVIGARVDLLKKEDDPSWEKEEVRFMAGIGMLKAKNSFDVDLVYIKPIVKRT